MTEEPAGERVERMLRTALEMEREGEAFFEQAARDCYNPTGRLIFEMLAQDERDHVRDIENLFRGLRNDGQWPEQVLGRPSEAGRRDVRRLLGELAREHGPALRADPGDQEALEIGLDFERRTVQFYEEHLAKATGPEERRFIELLVAEERHHVALLTELQALLSDPATWLRALSPP